MTTAKRVGAPPFSRHDTSLCPHLRELLYEEADGVQVKVEPSDYDASGSNGGSAPDPVAERRDAAFARYVNVIRWGATTEGVKRRKTSPPSCDSCSTTLSRPWACLTCPFLGCLSLLPSSSKGPHKACMESHWSSSSGKCQFAVEPSSGAVFCSECSDTTYSDTFESLFRSTRVKVEEENDQSREQSALGPGRGRGRGSFRAWQEGEKETTLEAIKTSCRGLRPLLNLSQTCFLSAVLQALIHNPLLKAYFLSDKHNRHVCGNGSRGLALGKPYLGSDNGSAVSGDREKGCMCCEMDRAFEEFHSEDKSPYGPITMLYAMWHASAELEGHGQQDAHSFFLAALDQIHAHAKGQLSSCNCIAHQTFAGSLLSTVTCSSCQHPSTTVDPILDIQLDFPTEPPSTGEALTLTTMLRRFCADERVGEKSKGYDCSKCGGGPGTVATRKLLIKKLPPVLSFQLKRFAHNATSTKIETSIRFPSHLDMRPYVETSQGSESLPESLYLYDLFAVVTHEGKLDNGHYWADVLSSESAEWWHCDDDKVTPTTLSAVLSQKAYMLFYVKRSLAYASSIKNLLTANTSAGVGVGVGVGNTSIGPISSVVVKEEGGGGGGGGGSSGKKLPDPTTVLNSGTGTGTGTSTSTTPGSARKSPIKGHGGKGPSKSDKHLIVPGGGKAGHPIRGMEV
ncbi:hypothetical protein BCR39DRAFT_481921 [Naematelia encephala]|uniref:Uncharacterized protein n=1 Tax=Naematelia encephala TaxID=71784 RepID=A0A1Y2B353_9TREE|nr:hypothetical protein BCR39DRAFT_481921 [Naematelia encephala]